jgi:hypothetical protein
MVDLHTQEVVIMIGECTVLLSFLFPRDFSGCWDRPPYSKAVANRIRMETLVL